jgi:hypothetical protein
MRVRQRLEIDERPQRGLVRELLEIPARRSSAAGPPAYGRRSLQVAQSPKQHRGDADHRPDVRVALEFRREVIEPAQDLGSVTTPLNCAATPRCRGPERSFSSRLWSR